MNKFLLDRITGIQQSLMAQHCGGRGMPNAVVGNEREVFLREFLQVVYPNAYRWSTGAITDSEGQRSGQIDIAVEHPWLPSFPMPGMKHDGSRLLLAESVAAVIEVKSDLSSQWDEAIATVEKVKRLKRRMTSHMNFGWVPPDRIPCFVIGYRGHTTTDGLARRWATTDESMRPEGALVVESGVFVANKAGFAGPQGLMAFIAALHDHLNTKGMFYPDLQPYLSPESHS